MPGISQRVMRIGERVTKWRPRGGLALAIIVPVIAVAAARGARCPGRRGGPGPAVWLVDRLQRRLQRLRRVPASTPSGCTTLAPAPPSAPARSRR